MDGLHIHHERLNVPDVSPLTVPSMIMPCTYIINTPPSMHVHGLHALTVDEADVPVSPPVEHAQHVHALHFLTRCHTSAALDALVQIQLYGKGGLCVLTKVMCV
jgi:hypothetical protein